MGYFTSQSGRHPEGPKTSHILYLIWTLISGGPDGGGKTPNPFQCWLRLRIPYMGVPLYWDLARQHGGIYRRRCRCCVLTICPYIRAYAVTLRCSILLLRSCPQHVISSTHTTYRGLILDLSLQKHVKSDVLNHLFHVLCVLVCFIHFCRNGYPQ